MTIPFRTSRGLLAAASLLCAQEAVDLDALDSKPAAPSRRAGDGVAVGGLKLNLYFDGMAVWSKPANADSASSLMFHQSHTSLLARVTTKDEIEVYADIIHPGDVFEATIPLRFFAPSLASVPVLGNSAIRGGRMIVPFGDFEEHPIYGGTVMNSAYLRSIIWSDYGMSLMVPFGMVKSEWYAVNGIGTSGTSVYIGAKPNPEKGYPKGMGSRIRIDPFPWLFATGSTYYDFLPTFDADPTDTLFDSTATYPADRALLGGLDLGAKMGPVLFRAGWAQAWVRAKHIPTHTKSGWYAESKWEIDDTWALRLRGGQIDPHSESVDDNDLTNINLGGIWTKGPVDVRFTYFRNFETHWPGSKTRPNNLHRVLLETFISI